MATSTDPADQRVVAVRYRDPVAEIWVAAARELGLNVERSDSVYASYDGRGTLRLGLPGQLDADDCVAQLVFHELCHALVGGQAGWAQEDWGLCNVDQRDLHKEHACHRVQAALADRYGLRGLMAVTTEHRPYWDSLPTDPLADGDDPAIELARTAFARAHEPPFSPALHDALSRTARIAEAVRDIAPLDSLWRQTVPRDRPRDRP